MTAAELIQSLPQRMKPGTGLGLDLVYHFKISGENGGDFTVAVKDGVCSVSKGLQGEPKCIVETKDTVYEAVESGHTNPQLAVLFGKLRVSNIPSLLKFVEMFEKANT